MEDLVGKNLKISRWDFDADFLGEATYFFGVDLCLFVCLFVCLFFTTWMAKTNHVTTGISQNHGTKAMKCWIWKAVGFPWMGHYPLEV